MANLILPSKRIVQPQQGAQIDWSNPLTKGLTAFLYTSGNGFVNAVNNSDLRNGIPANITQIADKPGSALLFNGTSSEVNFGDVASVDFTGAYSFYVLFRPDAQTGARRESLISKDNDTGRQLIIELNAQNLSGNAPGQTASISYTQFVTNATYLQKYTNANVLTNGDWHSVLIGSTDGSTDILIYLNGVAQALTNSVPAAGNIPGSMQSTTTLLYAGRRQYPANFDYFQGAIAAIGIFNTAPSNLLAKALYQNPWQLLAPQPRRIGVPVSGVITHTATGVLTGQGSTLSGTSQHLTLHTATGALVGQGSALSGTANKFITHTATGGLVGQGSTLSGTASRTSAGTHTATGALVGPGSVLSGTATHNALHTATGVLVGQGSVLSGNANLLVLHTATGILTGQGATLSGNATKLALHTAIGVLVGQGSILSGESQHLVTHTATGALVGQGSILSVSASINGATDSGQMGGGGGGAPIWRTEKTRKYKNNRKEIGAAIHAAIAQLEIQPVIQKEIQPEIQKIVVNVIQNDYSSEKQLINDAITQIRIIIDEMNDEEDAIMALIL